MGEYASNFPTAAPPLPEKLRRQPDGYLRIHHAADSIFAIQSQVGGHAAWAAFRGAGQQEVERLLQIDAEFLINQRTALLAALQRYPEETRRALDSIGNRDLTGVVAQLRAEAAYMAYLHSLPDMAVLKFGVGRDITCSNCAIGAHCVAANTSHYVSPGKGVDTVAGEGAALESIQLRLAGSAPHLYGADWVVGSEPVTLLDESGRHVTADAPYMLVTMAATRCTL